MKVRLIGEDIEMRQTLSAPNWDSPITVFDFLSSYAPQYEEMRNDNAEENANKIDIERSFENILNGYFVGVPINPNAEELNPAVLYFGDSGLQYVNNDFRSHFAPTDYPIIIGGIDRPQGMFVPFNVSSEGLDVAHKLLENDSAEFYRNDLLKDLKFNNKKESE